MKDAVSVVVVDDDASVRESMALLLSAAGHDVRTYASGPDFLAAEGADLEQGTARFCLLLDMTMFPLNGFEVFERVRAMPSTVPTVFATGQGAVPLAVKAMQLGALDFLEKPTAPDQLVETIKRAAAVFDAPPQEQGPGARAAPPLAEDTSDTPADLVATLTPRERDVLDLLVKGLTNKVIARELSISPRTVEVHRSRVKQKLSANSLADLMRMTHTAAKPL